MKEAIGYHNFLEDKVGDLGLSEAYRLRRMKGVYDRACEFTEESPSHDFHHIQLTLKYAEILLKEAKSLGFNPDSEKIFLAVCCHDLGRCKPSLHGSQSLDESVSLAKVILENRDYTERESEAVCQIIREHDQPENIPTGLEAKILKEADFLAGMGAWGILRTILWAGECGRPASKIIERLETSMGKRVASLELPLSREIAWKEWPLTRVFLAHLRRQYELTLMDDQEIETLPGEYFVFEGISGTGKQTQTAMLAEHFQSCGRTVEIVREPSDLLRETLRIWKGQLGEVTPAQRSHLMTADRIGLIEQKILPALRQKKIVIGDRSWISTMVYHGETEQEVAEILLINGMVPRPKAIFYLTLSPEEALARVDSRLQAGIGTRGDFENLEKMRQMAQRYEEALRLICPGTKIERINASGTPEQVFQEILASKGASL